MFIGLFVLAATIPVLSAQGLAGSASPDFTLHTTSHLVVLSVRVKDSHGNIVRGLMAPDFKIFEDGREQTVKQFEAEDKPVTLGIVVDASGSMRNKQAEVTTAVLALVRNSNPADETFVVNFNDWPLLGLPAGLPFSNDPGVLRKALLTPKPEGRTALYDAVILAADHLKKGKWENKALLVISDGGDNNSKHSFNDAIRAVQISGATTDTIGLFDPDEHEHNIGALGRLSKLTGGDAYTPPAPGNINSVCLKISQDIRASYTIAFTPASDSVGIFRKVKVTATSSAAGKLTARTRAGYFSD
jgi:VWFA-related protein